jgi:hypothetical protein
VTGRTYTPAERSPDAGVVMCHKHRAPLCRIATRWAPPAVPEEHPDPAVPARTYLVAALQRPSQAHRPDHVQRRRSLPAIGNDARESLALPTTAIRWAATALLERLSNIDPALDDNGTLRADDGTTA